MGMGVKKESIFLIEEENSGESLENSLGNTYEVWTASSGEEVIELIRRGFIPSLIVTGLDIGRVDGFKVCRQIRDNPETAEIPVVVLTKRSDAASEEKAFKAGVDDYIRHPTNAAVVHARLAHIFKKQQALVAAEPTHAMLMREIKKFATLTIPGNSEKECLARLQFINVEPIRNAFSVRWEGVEKRVITMADSMISASLIKGESYKYFAGEVFALAYPGLTPTEARERVRAVARSLLLKVLGDDLNAARFGDDLVSSTITYELFDSFNEEQDDEALRAFNMVKARIISGVQLSYIPIWRADNRAVDSYRATFIRQHGDTTLYGKDALTGGANDPLWPGLYEKLFDDITEQITLRGKKSPIYVVSIQVDLLLGKGFVQMIEKFFAKPELRNKLRIEVCGVDDSIKNSVIRAVIMFLRNVCDDVLVRVSPEGLLVHELKVFGITRIGMNYHDIVRTGLGQRGSYVVASHYAKKAQLIHMDTYIWGLDAVADFQVMQKTSFLMLSGKIFTDGTREIHSTYPLSPALVVLPPAAAKK